MTGQKGKIANFKTLPKPCPGAWGKVTPFVWGVVIFTECGLISVCLRK